MPGLLPPVKGGMDDETVAVVERFSDAIFELATAFGRLADALEERTERIHIGDE